MIMVMYGSDGPLIVFGVLAFLAVVGCGLLVAAEWVWSAVKRWRK